MVLRNLGESWQTQSGHLDPRGVCRDVGSGSARGGGQAQMGEGELVLVGTGRGHRDLGAADADPHQRANLEQLEAVGGTDGAAELAGGQRLGRSGSSAL